LRFQGERDSPQEIKVEAMNKTKAESFSRDAWCGHRRIIGRRRLISSLLFSTSPATGWRSDLNAFISSGAADPEAS
jgi:hypothetical protein